MLIVGHRGARAEAPENTLSGFRYLRSLGILRVELDIQVAKNQELVVVHDRNVLRTTGIDGELGQLSALELAQLDACHYQHPQWVNNDGIPTLLEVMRALQDFEHIQFEVKAQSQPDIETVVSQLPIMLRHFNLLDRAISTSFNPLYLYALQQHAPQVQRGLLLESSFQGDFVYLTQQLGCTYLGPHQKLCQPALVEQAHAARLQVSTWTVNEPERMRELQRMQIHSIITDVPSTALTIIPSTKSD